MGTWGITAFEDDSAMDYYDDFCESNQGVDQLEKGIELIHVNQYHMSDINALTAGFDEPVRPLVYVEIIAKALGKPSDKFPDDEYHNDMEIKKLNFDSIANDLSPKLKAKSIRAV